MLWVVGLYGVEFISSVTPAITVYMMDRIVFHSNLLSEALRVLKGEVGVLTSVLFPTSTKCEFSRFAPTGARELLDSHSSLSSNSYMGPIYLSLAISLCLLSLFSLTIPFLRLLSSFK